MAAHRYWRATAFSTYAGNSLELSEFQLLAAGLRVDASALLHASTAPVSGSLASLGDASTETWVEWSGSAVAALALDWDFGAGGGADVDDIRLGSSQDAGKFLLSCVVQRSDDAINWTVSKVVSSATWPGARALTQSTLSAPPYVRSNAFAITTAASVSIVLPPNLLVGSLLLIGVAARSAVTSAPEGWVELSETPVTAASGLGQKGIVYAKTATQDDSGSTVTFALAASATLSAYMVEMASLNGTPVVEQSATGKTDGATAPPISVLTSPGDARLAVVFGTTTNAFADSSATMTMTSPTGGQWTLRTVQGIAGLRGGIFTQPLDTGDTTAGALTSAGASSVNGFTWNVFVFVAGSGITQNRAAQTRLIGAATSSSAAVTGLIYGSPRVLVAGRGRKDYLNGQFGQSIGRVRGKTYDYGLPANKPYRCLVRLIREVDGLCIRAAWSTVDGSYDFQYVDELQSYTVLAYYLEHGKRAVVADGMTLANGKVELMS